MDSLSGEFEMVNNVGDLISRMIAYETTRKRAREMGSKVVNAPLQGSRDAFYANRSNDYQNEANRILSELVSSPGYQAVKTVCEAEYAEVTADRLKQMRSRLATALNQDGGETDKLSLSAFADQYLKHAASPDLARIAKSKESQPLIRVDRWSELGIGIDAHHNYWVI